MTDQPRWFDGEPDHNLPADILAAIGQMIVAHSHLEEALQHVIHALSGVDAAIGRTAIRAPRIADRWTMIEELAELRGVSIAPDLAADFKHDLSRLSGFRDYLAHGVFFRDEAGLVYCRKTRGTWTPPGSSQPVKHSAMPAAYLVTVAETARICAVMEAAFEAARALHGDVQAQLRALQG